MDELGLEIGAPPPARGRYLGLLSDVEHQLELLGHGQVLLRRLLRPKGGESVRRRLTVQRNDWQTRHRGPGPAARSLGRPAGPSTTGRHGRLRWWAPPALAPERLGGRWAPPPLAGPWLWLTFGGARDHAAPYLVLQAGKLRQRGPDLTLRI